MGLFKFNKNTNTDIALELFGTLGSGGNTQLSKSAKNILSRCNHRTDVLKEMINLCPNPTTQKELYIVSTAYVWLGAGYRKQAIEFLTKYINVGAYWEGTPNQFVNLYGFDIDQKKANIAYVYENLGMSYEGEYMFQEAFDAYKKAYELCPYYSIGIVKMANIYVKMNTIDNALKLLKEAKKSQYYKKYIWKDNVLGTTYKNDDFVKSIDRAIKDIQEKKLKGYVYRPRRNKL